MTRRSSFLLPYLTALVLMAGASPVLAAEQTDEERVQAALKKLWHAQAQRLSEQEQQFIDYLPALSIERLYLLMPEQHPSRVPDAPQFHGWVIADEGDPLPSAMAQNVLKIALRDILKWVRVEDGLMSMCGFIPHHALTLSDGKQRFDVLVCFECGEYEIYVGEELLLTDKFGLSTRAIWDRAYAAAGLRHPGFAQSSP